MSVKVISVKKNILVANDEQARINRALLDRHGIVMVNILASPGAGKTSLIMETIRQIGNRRRLAVIEGDIASTVDADKINAMHIPAVQINTDGGCHLDATMVASALDQLELAQLDLIFVENVGNLICTAEFALGARYHVVILSVPEGDDKPIKYPTMFADADVVVVNKTDVLPYFDFNMDAFRQVVGGLQTKAAILPVSAKTGDGISAWISWLENALHPNDD